MQAIYRKLGKILPLLSRQEAYYPANAQPLINRFGIALGFWIQNHEQLMIVLPGVPTELQKMFLHDVKPLLLKKFHGLQADKTLSIHTVGISEPRIIEKLKRDFFAMPFQFGIYPSEGETQICIRSPSQKMIQTLRKKIQQRIGQYIYSWKDETLAELIGQLLVKQKKTLSVAESCTGGSLAFSWTRHAGASRYFRGGVVVYDASAKSGIGVSKTVIKKHGQVSAAVAEELAKSARAFFNTDYGIGVTGIAGPAGGSAQKQVGLVYISIFSSARKRVTEKFLFWGNRDQIQRKAVIKAQELLWRILIA